MCSITRSSLHGQQPSLIPSLTTPGVHYSAIGRIQNAHPAVLYVRAYLHLRRRHLHLRRIAGAVQVCAPTVPLIHSCYALSF